MYFALANMDGFSVMRRAPPWFLFHSGAPAELSLLYADDSFIIHSFIQILNPHGHFCFTHKDTGHLVVGSPECVILPFFQMCVCEGVCSRVEKKEYIKCFQTSLYSDALLSSCSRRRRQRAECTPTCIISTASPLVTSPFPQALSSLTALSKIVS